MMWGNRLGYNIVGLIILAIGATASVAAALLITGPDHPPVMRYGILGGGIAISFLISLASRVVQQWEKAVVLRLGRFTGLKGPGLFWIIPLFDRIAFWIDLRVRTTGFAAEKTLTKDTVPVNVDAVLFWIVTDAHKAALEVANYEDVVAWAAQTALRDIMG